MMTIILYDEHNARARPTLPLPMFDAPFASRLVRHQ